MHEINVIYLSSIIYICIGVVLDAPKEHLAPPKRERAAAALPVRLRRLCGDESGAKESAEAAALARVGSGSCCPRPVAGVSGRAAASSTSQLAARRWDSRVVRADSSGAGAVDRTGWTELPPGGSEPLAPMHLRCAGGKHVEKCPHAQTCPDP